MKQKIHLVPHDGSWAIKKEGNQRASVVTDTKKEADEIGREMAKKNQTEFVIHDKKGRIQDSDSYGNDPNPPKDNKH